ncbi:MAG: hypothetical protein EZS28_024332 [Streblomastix strix]|uniref:Uncharacterized protein n=1 Tax=Streblomastix strix TaxID=222440 RepID=A0A5J4VC85_9EUKA|nr:MAG: hypothetical protein EZS28_024332 [Streblomastix strix]
MTEILLPRNYSFKFLANVSQLTLLLSILLLFCFTYEEFGALEIIDVVLALVCDAQFGDVNEDDNGECDDDDDDDDEEEEGGLGLDYYQDVGILADYGYEDYA